MLYERRRDLITGARRAAEQDRLTTLRSTGLLDTPAEEGFDRYVRLAKRLFDTPIALISLVDSDRQWFKAKQGLDAEETPREWAFCSHAIDAPDVMVVEDASVDLRFMDNPLVTGDLGIRFYAGAPVSVDGQRLGTLCVIDTEPRALGANDRRALADLAALLSREIETNHLGRARADRSAVRAAVAAEADHHFRNLFSKMGAVIAMTARETASAAEMPGLLRRRLMSISEIMEASRAGEWAQQTLDQVARAAFLSVESGWTVPLGAFPATQGDDIRLTGGAASVIVLLINELCHETLARRGTLAGTELRWRRDGPILHLTYAEPAIAAADPEPGSLPSAVPFGSTYLTSLGPEALSGAAEVRLSSDALVYELSLPIDRIEAGDDFDAFPVTGAR